MRYVYGLLCILGTVLPYGALLPWLVENGPDIQLFLADAIRTGIGTFAWLDVMVSALVLLVFIWTEGLAKGMKHLWLPTLGTFTVGVSLGLPLFLLMRTVHLEKVPSP
ncbi:DUF2834 domain-containing protein [Parahaliea maris]|uniref:DUF2834 domain-containing protein n=1 Tax=Parahaliea maris TaxID=2716870 RepID=A0A5C9A349_9GAMM|nr:DUF2834 domain-containing protein [Parahaliea maris]TXS94200.1 DUF2834 domain-containing protein [Parahaliea maris]